jgi:hypothetical protein
MENLTNHQSFGSMPPAVIEYIDSVIKSMRYCKAVRQDVRAELEAHFEDALTDCTGPHEHEAAIQEMIEAFGDVRFLARLIRRAKKRGRPAWQRAVIRAAQVSGVLLLYVVLCTSRLFIGAPVISVDYIDRINQAVRQDRPEALNAREDIVEAIACLPEPPKNLLVSAVKDMNDLDRQALEEYLPRCEKAFSCLRAASDKPFYWNHYDSIDTSLLEGIPTADDPWAYSTELSEQFMAPLRDIRMLGMTMRCQIDWDCERAMYDKALQNSVALIQLGRHLSGTGLLCEELVGVAITGLGTGSIRRVLDEGQFNESVLAHTYTQLAHILQPDTPWITFEAEKALYHDLIQRCFTDNGRGNGRLLRTGVPLAAKYSAQGLRNLVLFDLPDRRKVTRQIDALFETIGHCSHTRTPWMQFQSQSERPLPGSSILDVAMLKRIADICWRLRTSNEAILAIVAIKHYKKSKGMLPDSLHDLVNTGVMTALPIDFYSDGPLGYMRTKEGFILYSRGKDLKDDGGAPAVTESGKPHQYGEHGDWIFWPVTVGADKPSVPQAAAQSDKKVALEAARPLNHR